jgi:hypothetical protein
MDQRRRHLGRQNLQRGRQRPDGRGHVHGHRPERRSPLQEQEPNFTPEMSLYDAIRVGITRDVLGVDTVNLAYNGETVRRAWARPSVAHAPCFEERRQLCRADLDGPDRIQPQGGQGFVRLLLHERCLLDLPVPRRSGTARCGGCVGLVGVDLDDRKKKKMR